MIDPAPSVPPPVPPLRPAWRVGVYAGAITLAIGAAVGLLAAVATGAIHRDPRWAGEQFGRAFAPFILIVAIAAYAIQRSRIKQRAQP